MDRLEAMSTFLAVVETGSLSAAARQLKTPLATVSRKVSELESHLQTRLFNRSSRKLVLTEAGSSYFAVCKRILADVTEAERAVSGEYSAPTGELIVTAPVGLGRSYLIPILADFLKAYPDIKASLLLADRVQSLFQEQIDLGLRIGALPDSSLIAVRLGTTRRMVCASPAYQWDDWPSPPLHLRLFGPPTCENDAPSIASSRQHELRRRHVARVQSMGR